MRDCPPGAPDNHESQTVPAAQKRLGPSNGPRDEYGRIERDLMVALAATTVLETGLRLCLEASLRLQGLDAGGFYLRDDASDALDLSCHIGLSPEFVASARSFGVETPQHALVLTGRPIYSRYPELGMAVPEARRQAGLRAFGIIPIEDHGRVVGCLYVASRTVEEIGAEERLALETIAAGAAQAVVRLRTQESLRASEANYRTLFHTIEDLILVAAIDGRLLHGNAAVERKLGYAPAELQRLTVADLHPANLREEAAVILAAMLQGERQTCPLPLARKDGTLLPVETRVWFGEWAGQRCLFGICKDLSGEQEAQQRFERLFRHNPMPMALSSLPDRRVADVNDAWLELLGYERSEVIGKTTRELGIFVDPHLLDDIAVQLRTHGFIQAVELRVRAKDGSLRDGVFSGEIFHSQGKSFVVSVMVDITGRRQAEALLRDRLELQDQLTKVAASVPGLICAFRLRPDGSACMPFATDAIGDLYGLTPAQVREDFSPILNLVHPDDRAQLGRSIAESARTMQPWHDSFRVLHPVKGLRWMEGNSVPRPEADGGILWHGFVQDITARKQAEEELRNREFLLGEMGRLARVGGWEVDAATGQGRWTDEVERIHDFDSPQEPSREMGYRFYPGESRRKIEAAVERALSSGESYDLELEFVSAKGVRKWVRTQGLPVVEGGRIVKLRGTLQDITERKRAEARVARERRRTEFLLELHQRAGQMSDKELFDHVLEQAVQLTESAIGFFHQVAEDQSTLVLTTWNRRALENCTATFESHYPINQAGNWVDCIRLQRPVVYNDYAHSPNQRGLPPGHARVERFMSVPVIQDGKVRIIFGVGNKAEDYDDEDVSQVLVVANELHKIMRQRAAQSQVRQLSRAVEQSTVSIAIMDPGGVIEYVNPRFTQLTGYTIEEIRGRNPRIHAGAPAGSVDGPEPWSAVRAGGEWHGEFLHARREGEPFWASASCSRLTNSSGETTHLVMVAEDITERRRFESQREALLSLGRQLNSARDAASAGRALLGAVDRLWHWDSAALDLLTDGSNQVRAVLRIDTIDGVRREVPTGEGRMTERIRRVMERGAELILKDGASGFSRDGVPFGDVARPSATILCVPIHREGNVVGIFSLHSYQSRAYGAEDLRVLQALADYCGGALERIRSEETGRESEERYRNLVEATFEVIWELDAEGRYSYVSPRIGELLGFTPEEIQGRAVRALMPEAEGRRFEAALRQAAESRTAFAGVEGPLSHRDGHWVIFEHTGIPLVGEKGHLRGFRGISRDVSERRRLEEQIRQSQKIEAVGRLAGGVAHDFNNILASMMITHGLLQQNPTLNAEARQAVEELGREAQRAAGLTRQLLMFSRRSVLCVRSLDVNELVDNLLKMLRRLIGEQVALRFDAMTGLPPVEADAGMLEQVLVNLVVNARDAMPRGGRITLATGLEVFAETDLVGRPEARAGRFVRLLVADTGSGISAETMKRIFEPFFTTKEPGKGTGLGLATVHGIVAQHKGWVEVTSRVGEGAAFRVFLPAVDRPRETTSTPEAAVGLPRGTETILLVEDDPTLRHIATLALRSFGYQVHTAVNGREALAVWERVGVGVSLVLTDMVMPEGINGLELIEHLRRLKPGLKAILSSGYSTEIARPGVLAQAGVVYLPKPYEATVLAETVQRALQAPS
ncbi:MAG: PAS domain S-box protein [Verrucomicrobia bacterium]|nr:PAS domain S-box protein [Verrucomicrobiota bacterium]